ncbi:MAG: hypothetical protein B7Y61_03110 [Rhizobiales bacterium 35-66-30]|nr:MAG: hypothetical protein B7Y95_18965 [Rhizobiales bacterium 32-66-11]OYY88265.1 MAG: hypothetical protein B7Y61_03110 [Rhizobiales bacterium 35-66-30]
MELTLESLIRSARAAVIKGCLGLQRGCLAPAFVHPDGSPCAISAALSPATRELIRADGNERLSWLELKCEGYFELAPDLALIEALATLQIGYDRCFDADPDIRARRKERFLAYILTLDPDRPPRVWPSEISMHSLWED